MQGFISEASQDTALSGKYLRRLIEIVLPFTEGSLKALMESFISNVSKDGK